MTERCEHTYCVGMAQYLAGQADAFELAGYDAQNHASGRTLGLGAPLMMLADQYAARAHSIRDGAGDVPCWAPGQPGHQAVRR